MAAIIRQPQENVCAINSTEIEKCIEVVLVVVVLLVDDDAACVAIFYVSAYVVRVFIYLSIFF